MWAVLSRFPSKPYVGFKRKGTGHAPIPASFERRQGLQLSACPQPVPSALLLGYDSGTRHPALLVERRPQAVHALLGEAYSYPTLEMISGGMVESVHAQHKTMRKKKGNRRVADSLCSLGCVLDYSEIKRMVQ